MDRRNLGSELKSTTLYGREFQIFMMRSLKNAALKRESLSGLFDMSLKNLGFLGFLKKPKKPKKSEFRFLGFLKIKNRMSDLSV